MARSRHDPNSLRFSPGSRVGSTEPRPPATRSRIQVGAPTPSLPSAVARGLALAAWVGVAACAGGSGEGDPGWGDRRWALEGPQLRIGSVDDPDYAFGYVYELARGPDGRLYTLHQNQAEVMRWTPDGRPDGVIGRQGEGPGEFRSPRQLGFFGDSLWVMDSRTVRVSYFDGDGALLGTRNLPLDMEADPEQPWKSPPRPRRPLRDGTFYGAAPAWSEQIVRGELTSALHVRMSADGAVLDTLWDQPYRPTDVLGLLRDGGGTFGPQPFGDQPLMVITSRGITILHRRVDGSEAEPSLHLAALDWSGDTLTSRRIPYRPEPLPPAEVERAAKEQAAGLHGFVGERLGISLAQMEADVADAIYGPSHHPFVARMLVTEQGRVWLERTGSEAGTWLVLTADGDPTGRVTLPEGLRVLRIDGDTLWGVETDDLDVNYVVQYRLVETPS